MGIVKVSDETGELKRFEDDKGRILAEVEGTKLILTKLGEKAGYSARRLTLLNGKLPAC